MKFLIDMKKSILKFSVLLSGVIYPFNAMAGIDWSKYGNEPALFLGWKKSLYFAIAALVLLGLSWIISESYKDKNGTVEGGAGCFLSIVNVAMIICAICSAYLLIPLAFIYYCVRDGKKK